MRLLTRVSAALLLLLAAGVSGRGPLPVSAASPAAATFRVGTAMASITPLKWPVHAAAYGIHTASHEQAGRPFLARSIAISGGDGSLAHTVVLTVLDSQGYFAAYKEDPVLDPGHFGTAGIRKQVQQDTGLDIEHVIIATTHTHNSPDSVGVWGGGEDPNNVDYLQVVRDGAIRSIEQALATEQRATLSVGMVDGRQYQDTLDSVRGDPGTYPMDRLLRVMQARNTSGQVVATIVNYAEHGTVLGQLDDVISPDWPGEVAHQLDARWGSGTTVVVPGAVGRTWPNFPDPHTGKDWQKYLATFGALVVGRVDAALARARPLVDGTVAATGMQVFEPVANPVALVLLSTDRCPPTIGVCGTMRSQVPPYLVTPAVVGLDLNALRVGDIFLGGTPAEAYPEIAVELQRRVHAAAVCGDDRHVFTLSLTNDQVGYTPTSDEYALAVRDGGDEGLFTLNQVEGNSMINHQLGNARALGFTTDADYSQVQPLLPPQAPYGPAPDLADASGPPPNCTLGTTTTSSGPSMPASSGLPGTGRGVPVALAPWLLVALGALSGGGMYLAIRAGQQP